MRDRAELVYGEVINKRILKHRVISVKDLDRGPFFTPPIYRYIIVMVVSLAISSYTNSAGGFA